MKNWKWFIEIELVKVTGCTVFICSCDNNHPTVDYFCTLPVYCRSFHHIHCIRVCCNSWIDRLVAYACVRIVCHTLHSDADASILHYPSASIRVCDSTVPSHLPHLVFIFWSVRNANKNFLNYFYPKVGSLRVLSEILLMVKTMSFYASTILYRDFRRSYRCDPHPTRKM